LDAAVGWDGVSADTVESTVTLSIDGELVESSTPVVASVWNSAAAFDARRHDERAPWSAVRTYLVL